MVIILVVIGGYSIISYFSLFYLKSLYFILDYFKLLYLK
jgi:hypothetical protein